MTNIPRQLLNRELDYLLIIVFIFAQHGDYVRARIIIDGILALKERSTDLQFEKAILEYHCCEYKKALGCLDALDQTTGAQSEDSCKFDWARKYLRARCYCFCNREKEAQDIAAELASYGGEPIFQQ